MNFLKKHKVDITIIVCVLLFVVALFFVLKEDRNPNSSGKKNEEGKASGKYYVEMNVEEYGTIKLELDGDVAPITVANFVKLVESKFYDGLTFHRVMDGFMAQGGDPEGTGMGGSSETIKGEFSSNGVENNINHVRGVISMARTNNPDSASSQFFIMHQDAPHLDGDYAAFGHVIEGIEVIDKICENTPVEDNNGTVLPQNQPKILTVRMIDAPAEETTAE